MSELGKTDAELGTADAKKFSDEIRKLAEIKPEVREAIARIAELSGHRDSSQGLLDSSRSAIRAKEGIGEAEVREMIGVRTVHAAENHDSNPEMAAQLGKIIDGQIVDGKKLTAEDAGRLLQQIHQREQEPAALATLEKAVNQAVNASIDTVAPLGTPANGSAKVAKR